MELLSPSKDSHLNSTRFILHANALQSQDVNSIKLNGSADSLQRFSSEFYQVHFHRHTSRSQALNSIEAALNGSAASLERLSSEVYQVRFHRHLSQSQSLQNVESALKASAESVESFLILILSDALCVFIHSHGRVCKAAFHQSAESLTRFHQSFTSKGNILVLRLAFALWPFVSMLCFGLAVFVCLWQSVWQIMCKLPAAKRGIKALDIGDLHYFALLLSARTWQFMLMYNPCNKVKFGCYILSPLLLRLEVSLQLLTSSLQERLSELLLLLLIVVMRISVVTVIIVDPCR